MKLVGRIPVEPLDDELDDHAVIDPAMRLPRNQARSKPSVRAARPATISQASVRRSPA